MVEEILLESRCDIDWIVLNRAEKRNALTLSMWQRIYEILSEFVPDKHHLAIGIRGNKTFSAGLDIEELHKVVSNKRIDTLLDVMQNVFQRIVTLPAPFITYITENSYGPGTEIALVSDFLYGDRNAKIYISEFRMGAISPLIYIIHPLIYTNRQLYSYMLTGEPLDMKAAEKMGIVTAIIDEGGFEKATELLSDKLKRINRNSFLIFRDSVKLHILEDLAYGFELLRTTLNSNDIADNAKFFLKKHEVLP